VPQLFQPPFRRLLATNQTRWLCSYPLDTPETYGIDGQMEYLDEIGVTNYYSGPNLFCRCLAVSETFLVCHSCQPISRAEAGTATLLAGSTLENVDGYFLSRNGQPQFPNGRV